MTRDGVARAAGLASDTAHRIEVEQGVPGLDVAEKLADVLGINVCWLVYGLDLLMVSAPAGTLRCAAIGARLREVREQRGLTKKGLGEASEMTGQTVANVEDGRRMPSVATAEALAKGLGVSPCWLAYGEGPQALPKPARKRRSPMTATRTPTGTG